MTDTTKEKKLIGRAEYVTFLDVNTERVAARIDTGARSSSVWATEIREMGGSLSFILFGPGSQFYTGERLATRSYWKTVVASSMGAMQERYVVRLRIKIKGKRMRARFTLADRSTQVYPVLVGRNILRGKFIVDVRAGKPLVSAEKARTAQLKSLLKS